MEIIDLAARLEKAREVLARMAEGDLNVSIEVEHFTDSLAPLEIGINSLITDLRETFESNQAKTQTLLEQRGELEKRLETIEKQGRVIQKLSTPIMEVWDGVLVLPIIGEIDAARSVDIMNSLLARVDATHDAWVIIDVTGMDGMDARSASYLIEMTKAVSLLGAQAVLTGIRTDVAQTLANARSELRELTTRRHLRDGLRLCLSRMAEEGAGKR